MSRNAHKGLKLSRRDDLESCLYMILVLINGYSLWQGLKPDAKKSVNDKILEIKERLWGDKLTEGLPENFKKFTKAITDMKFEDEPNYDMLIEFMRDLTIYDNKGKAQGSRKIDDSELTDIKWNKFISGTF